jgi:hypothetical protein
MKMADLMCVEITLGIACSGCKELVPVNGPREVARCAACDAETPLAGALRWQELLTVRSPPVDVFKALAPQKDGATDTGGRPAVQLSATRAWPKCPCGRRFEGVKLAGAFAGSRQAVACPACSKDITVLRPPASFRAGAPSVVAVVGADIVPDGPQKPHLPKPAAAKERRAWWAMFDRSLA